MKLSDIAGDALARAFDQDDRPHRVRFAGQQGLLFQGTLVPQRLDIVEAVCDGVTAHITCLATRADLPLKELLGLPVEVQIVTDTRGLRRLCVLVTEVRQGQSDGSVTVVQFTGRDIFAAMEGRRSNRVFLNKSVPDILRIVLDGWRKSYAALARAFDYQLDIDASAYPSRALTFQVHQSDADFLRALCRRHGIAWFFRAGPDGDKVTPSQQLVFFDDAQQLAENSAGPVKYHRRAGTETRDTISLLAPTYTLVNGGVSRASYDHESARVDTATDIAIVDQGSAGNEFAAALQDARIELPHAGDSWADHDRSTRLDMQRHELRARSLHGVGGVRAQAVGEYNRIDGHPLLDTCAPQAREVVTVRLEHWAENSLPKELNERAQGLLAASAAGIPAWATGSSRPSSSADAASNAKGEHRYTNRFLAVPRDVPIVPAWDPQTDLPSMALMTGTVVGPEGESVWCDELGRVKLRFHGLDPALHEHASGAGTNGNAGDSAWVRVNFLWAGDGFGVIFPLRCGMEVSIGFEQGDPSRPMIVGARYNGRNMPPRFDQMGSLPANRALSGIVTREVRGTRQQQLRFNDTQGNISVQLGSDHGATQINLGNLATPMNEGHTQPRGEGFEVRTDKAGAIRSAEALLISTWKRLQAADKQLSADEHQDLLRGFLDLFKSLGRYAGAHQGLPVDTAPQTQLRNDIEAGTEPTISITAPGGVATTTPKTLVNYAGVNIDCVAQQHYQQTAGGYYVVNAGKGISTFAHEGGIKTIAHRGKLLMQSQHDDTRIDSGKDIKLSAAGGKIVGMAQDEITFITSGGAYLKLKGGQIEIGGPGTLDIKTAGHHWGGPATLSSELPTFGEGDLGRTPVLLRPTDGMPAQGIKVQIARSDGVEVTGQTDGAGTGPKIVSNSLEQLKAVFYVQRT